MLGVCLAVASSYILASSKKLKLTDAELAAILGHEMSHALREHSRERASTEQMKDVGIAVASSAAGLGDLGSAALNMAAQYTFTLPFSRTHETEADLIGRRADGARRIRSKGGYKRLGEDE